MTTEKNRSALVGITEISKVYLPLSKKRIRRLVSIYLDPIFIGNRMFVDRGKLEALLSDPNREKFPLNI